MRRLGMAWLYLVLAGIVALAIVLYQVSKPPPGVGLKPMLPAEVRVALEGKSRLTSMEHGKLAWTMVCQGLADYSAEGMVTVDSPQAEIPLKEGGTVEVQGREGRYFQKSMDIGISGEVEVRLTRLGHEDWRMAGDTASYRRAEDAFYISELTGVMSPAGGDSVGIQGAEGRYDLKGRNMRLTRDVNCRWGRDMTVATGRLDYGLDSQLANTDDAVTIEGAGWTLSGRGLRANLATKRVEVLAEVSLLLKQGMGGPQ